MLVSAAALAVPWRQRHCNTALMCPWVLRVPLSQGVNGWLWLPLIYIKALPILCLWRDDMVLCTLLILLISYGPSLLIPSCCNEFSVFLFTFCLTDIFEASFCVCLAFLSPFFQVVFVLGYVAVTFYLTGWCFMTFFISCGTGQAASPPLWSWLGALDGHPAKQRSSTQSSLTAGRKITGAGCVSGWFTDVVTVQAFG